MKKIYLQSNNHADRKPSQLIKKEKKTHVSKTGRNKIRRKIQKNCKTNGKIKKSK